jgi:SAM-dependent methyltransferase
MSQTPDSNAAIWHSEEVVANWVASSAAREAKRVAQWRLMGELLPYGQDEAFTFLDLGAGTGTAAQAILQLFPHSRAVLGEYSAEMIKQGTQAMARFAGRFEYVEFDMVAGEWPSAIPSDLAAAVTSQCVHHLPDERKAGLFAEIFEHLAPGGWYLNFDPVTTEEPVVEAAWERANERQDPSAAEKARHRDHEEQRRYANHTRYMIPLEPQLGFIRAAGFEGVDVYWKHLDYVIYGGQRPA